ncbi:MAG: homoserine kinase [Desulfobacterales bacterium]|nr:homoserine kinase [Desulfobacterales bacterium]
MKPAQQCRGGFNMIPDMGDIHTVLNLYGISGITGIERLSSGYANENYKVTAQKGVFLYRVCIQQDDIEKIRYEIRVLSALQKTGFPAAYPVPRTDGGFISDSARGRVVVYDFVEGEEPRIDEETAEEIGKHIALLNRFPADETYSRKNTIHMEACLDLINRFKSAPFQYPEIYSYFKGQTDYLIKPLAVTLPRGLIHGDVFPDNTIFSNGRLAALIDFEEVCVDTLLMEIGMSANGFCFIDNRLEPELLASLLSAYHSVRPISAKESHLLYHYIQWAAHGTLSWHLRYALLYRENPRQLDRVTELMERVERLRRSKPPQIKGMNL